MQLTETTRSYQARLASYCRTDQPDPLPGASERGLATYRRLVFNNLKGNLAATYPLAYALLGEERWQALVHEFFQHHDPQSPQVWRLSGEFFEYAAAADFAGRWGYPFLTDLLLMEWTETEVYNMPDAAWPAFTLEGDWLQDPVVVTPELRLVPLSYPVHIQPAGEITAGDEDQYFLLAFRQRPACKVQFLSISPLHVFLLEQLGQAPQSVAALTALAEAQLGLEQAQLQAPAIDFLQRLQQKGCVLGFAPTSETVG